MLYQVEAKPPCEFFSHGPINFDSEADCVDNCDPGEICKGYENYLVNPYNCMLAYGTNCNINCYSYGGCSYCCGEEQMGFEGAECECAYERNVHNNPIPSFWYDTNDPWQQSWANCEAFHYGSLIPGVDAPYCQYFCCGDTPECDNPDADEMGSWYEGATQICCDNGPPGNKYYLVDSRGDCDCTTPPDCTGKVCGDDGCGGSCGSCDDNNPCTRDICSFDGGECYHIEKSCSESGDWFCLKCDPNTGDCIADLEANGKKCYLDDGGGLDAQCCDGVCTPLEDCGPTFRITLFLDSGFCLSPGDCFKKLMLNIYKQIEKLKKEFECPEGCEIDGFLDGKSLRGIKIYGLPNPHIKAKIDYVFTCVKGGCIPE